MISKKIREEFEANYPMPFACGWNSMTSEYDCIWEEHAGEEEVEALIVQHNDRLAVWIKSRESLVIDLPRPWQTNVGAMMTPNGVKFAIESAGLKFTVQS